MNNLLALAEAGDSVATSIYIDLKDALNHPSLTQKQRDCLIMRYLHRYTNKEITEALNVKSDNSARKHIEGGLKKIRKILGGD
jgi:DNA-directed RNA polymerase specialized sigma24 family protein